MSPVLGLNPLGMGRVCVACHGYKDPKAAPKLVGVTANTVFPGGIDPVARDGHVEYTKLNNLWPQLLLARTLRPQA